MVFSVSVGDFRVCSVGLSMYLLFFFFFFSPVRCFYSLADVML